VAQVVPSTTAHGRIRRIDFSKALQVPGVVTVLTAKDIPGENNVGPVVHDEELLASQEVHFLGQAVAVVVGESYAACRAGVAAVQVDCDVLPAIVTLDEAIAQVSSKKSLNYEQFCRLIDILDELLPVPESLSEGSDASDESFELVAKEIFICSKKEKFTFYIPIHK
jgi:xanthine dehydrogenase molybdopterin-binding subunit B